MTAHGRGRLFVALDLPAEVRHQLAGWARRAGVTRGAGPAPRVRLVEAESLHLTLCFLGSRPLEEVPALSASLAEAAAPVSGLSLGAPVWLPARRPRALAVEVRDAGRQLERLQRGVVEAVAETVDWEPESRRFRPHVTVARMAQGGAPRERELAPTPALAFAAEALTLYRSWLSRTGAEYEALESVAVERGA